MEKIRYCYGNNGHISVELTKQQADLVIEEHYAERLGEGDKFLRELTDEQLFDFIEGTRIVNEHSVKYGSFVDLSSDADPLIPCPW